MPESRHLAAVPDHVDDTNGPNIERRLIGTVMNSPKDLAAVRDLVGVEHFTAIANADLWNAICAAAEKGQPTDPVTIAEHLLDAGAIRRQPSPAYPFEVYGEAMTGTAGHWAGLLSDRLARRRATEGAIKLQQAAATPGIDLSVLAEMAQQVAADAMIRTAAEGPALLADLADEYLDTYMSFEAAVGAATPWPDLNELLAVGGFERGQLVTFAGGTGSGKSIALTDVARHHAVKLRLPTLMFTLEMKKDQVLSRVLAGLAEIPERKIRKREVDSRDLIALDRARNQLRAAPLWVLDKSHTAPAIIGDCRRAKDHVGDVHTVVVDYIQLMKPDRRRENRQLEVAANTQMLKQFALTDDVLVVAGAQLNRGPGSRADKRPTLGDLRESGEIENSSDVVILIHRPDQHDKESNRAGEADFDVAKQRGGSSDTVTVAAQLHITRFAPMGGTEPLRSCVNCFTPTTAALCPACENRP